MSEPIVKIHSSGLKSETWLNKAGEKHRVGAPAVIYYYKNDKILSEYYYLNNKPYRNDGPCYTRYNEFGIILSITHSYYINNKPSTILYHSDGSLRREVFKISENFYRKDGPSSIFYRKNGTVAKHYYLDNTSDYVQFPEVCRVFFNEKGLIYKKDYFINNKLMGFKKAQKIYKHQILS